MVDQKSPFCYNIGIVINKEQQMTALSAIAFIAALLTMRAYFKGWNWDEV